MSVTYAASLARLRRLLARRRQPTAARHLADIDATATARLVAALAVVGQHRQFLRERGLLDVFAAWQLRSTPRRPVAGVESPAEDRQPAEVLTGTHRPPAQEG